MREALMISEWRAALRRQGVWGPRAKRLLGEWTEHVREDTAQRVEKGAAPEVAQESAWEALGNPEALAKKAGRELARGSWLGRHLWLGGLVLPGLAWLALICAISLLPAWVASRFWDIEILERTHPTALHASLRCWQVIFNWLPWLVAVAWLARTAVRMPGGWRLFWITSITLTTFVPSVWMVIQMPQHGPGSGSLNIMMLGIFGIIVNTVFHVLGYGAVVGPWWMWFRQTAAHPGPLVQTAVMALGALAFYARMSGRFRWPATGAAMVALLLILAFVCGVPTFVL